MACHTNWGLSSYTGKCYFRTTTNTLASTTYAASCATLNPASRPALVKTFNDTQALSTEKCGVPSTSAATFFVDVGVKSTCADPTLWTNNGDSSSVWATGFWGAGFPSSPSSGVCSKCAQMDTSALASNVACSFDPAIGICCEADAFLATPTQTSTASSSVTPSRTRSSTGTPSVTPSQTRTGTNTGTMTKTSTATGTPSKTASNTPSNSASASVTPSTSRTPSSTASSSKTPSSTPTPSKSASGTTTPSKSASITPSQSRTTTGTANSTRTASPTPTPSRTASGTASSSKTSSVTQTSTRTPSTTITQSRTSSTTITGSRTASPTRSISLTMTATRTPSFTRSPVYYSPTPTETNSITPSNCPTPAGTATQTGSSTDTASATSTLSSTPSATQTITASVTATQTQSLTTTATQTRSMTSTASTTNTPIPLRVNKLEQEIPLANLHDDMQLVVVTLYGAGYRFAELDSTPNVTSRTYAIQDVVRTSDSIITIRIPLQAALWSNALIRVQILRVMISDYYIDVAKTAGNVPASAVSVQPTVVAYGQQVNISAPLIANMPIKTLRMVTSFDAAASCNEIITVPPNTLLCTFLEIPDALFGRPAVPAVGIHYNTAEVHLAATLIFVRPRITAVGNRYTTHTDRTTLHARAPFLSMVPGAIANSDLAAHLGTTKTATVTMQRIESISAFVANADLWQVSPTCLLGGSGMNLSVTSRSAVSAEQPVITSMQPRRMYLPPPNANVNHTFILSGKGFMLHNLPRISNVTIAARLCDTLEVLSDTSMACHEWNASQLDLSFSKNVAAAQVVVQFVSGGWLSWSGLQVLRGAAIRQVVPRLIEPGQQITLYGHNFLPVTQCSECVPVQPRIHIGPADCIAVKILSSEVAECIAPSILGADGFPVATVSMTTSDGWYSGQNATVVYVDSVSVEWYLPPELPTIVLGSGVTAGQLIPVLPPPVLAFSGTGSLRCRVTAADVDGSVVVGKVIVNIDVGDKGLGTEFVQLESLGMRAKSNSTVFLVTTCDDATGARSPISTDSSAASSGVYTRWGVHTAAWYAEWDPETAVRLAQPQVPVSFHSIAATITIIGDVRSYAKKVHTLFLCRSVVTKHPVVASSLSSVDSALAGGGTVATSSGAVEAAPTLSLDSHSAWNLTFESTSADQLYLGSVYYIYASCEWLPTGEVIELQPLNFTVAAASITWNLLHAQGTTLHAFRGKPYLSRARLEHNIPPESWTSASVDCAISIVAESGLRVRQASLLPYSAVLQDNTTFDEVPIVVDGQDDGTAQARFVCTLWGRRVESNTYTLVARTVSLLASSTLPAIVTISDASIGALLRPVVRVEATDSLGLPAGDMACRLGTTTPGMRIRLNTGDAEAIIPVNGRIILLDAIAFTQDEASTLPRTIAFTLACKRSLGDDPEPIRWEAAVMTFARKPATAFPSSVNEGNELPDFGVQVFQPVDSVISPHNYTENLEYLQGLIRCIVSVQQAPQTNTDTFAYVQRSSAYMNSTGYVRFQQVLVRGPRGSALGLTVGCGLGKLPVGDPMHFTIAIPACPAGTSTSGFDCAPCPQDTYSLGKNEVRCITCPPVGVQCSNGHISVLPHYFRPLSQNGRPIDESTELHTCYNRQSCIVNVTSLSYSCATGYTGALCGVCDDVLDYSAFGATCAKCWPDRFNKGILIAVGVLFLIITSFIALRQNGGNRSDAMIVFRIMLGYLQALNSLQGMKAGGTPVFRELMGWTQSVSESPLSTGPVQCFLRWPYLIKFMATISIPFAAAVLVVIEVLVALICKSVRTKPRCSYSCTLYMHYLKRWHQERRHVAALVLFAVIGYMPIVGTAFKAIQCYERPVAGKYYVQADLSEECNSYSHIIVRFTAVGVLAAYGLGFPITLFTLLSKMTAAKLNDESFIKAFSFLFGGYKRGKVSPKQAGNHKGSLIWWESTVLLRKASIVAFAVVVTNPYYQIVGTMIACATFMILQQHFQPYERALFNSLETLALAVLFMTSATSGILLRNLDAESKPADLSSLSSIIITLALLAINLGTALILMVSLFAMMCKRASQLKAFTKVRIKRITHTSAVTKVASTYYGKATCLLEGDNDPFATDPVVTVSPTVIGTTDDLLITNPMRSELKNFKSSTDGAFSEPTSQPKSIEAPGGGRQGGSSSAPGRTSLPPIAAVSPMQPAHQPIAKTTPGYHGQVPKPTIPSNLPSTTASSSLLPLPTAAMHGFRLKPPASEGFHPPGRPENSSKHSGRHTMILQ